eukprot:6774497-Pyramimonas_sp.AAC.2
MLPQPLDAVPVGSAVCAALPHRHLRALHFSFVQEPQVGAAQARGPPRCHRLAQAWQLHEAVRVK